MNVQIDNDVNFTEITDRSDTKKFSLPFLKRSVLGTVFVMAVSTQAVAEPLEDFNKEFDCLMEPNKTVEVSSPVEGIIDDIAVKRGQYVKKGQEIFSLRSELEQEDVKLTTARYEFGQRAVKRNEDLYQQKLMSIHDKDELETDTKLAGMELERAKVRLNLKTTKSPISGYVINLAKSNGEYVETEPVMTIVSVNPLFVEVVAPKEYLRKIKRGQTATVVPEKPIDKKYKAKVTIVDPVVDPASGTFRIRLELKNPKAAIPSGLKCDIKF